MVMPLQRYCLPSNVTLSSVQSFLMSAIHSMSRVTRSFPVTP